MGKFKNYYQVLGLPDFATADQIKQVYRKLARELHPDLNPNKPEAEAKFKEVNEAYEVLGDADRKATFDEGLRRLNERKQPQNGKPNASSNTSKPKQPPPSKPTKEAPKPAPTPVVKEARVSTGPSWAQALSEKLGERFNFKQPKQRTTPDGQPTRGQDVTVTTEISLEEATQGVVKSVMVQYEDPCDRCTPVTPKGNCSTCQGEGILKWSRKIDVRIPAGVKSGSKIRVSKEGSPGINGGESGDLFLLLNIAGTTDSPKTTYPKFSKAEAPAQQPGSSASQASIPAPQASIKVQSLPYENFKVSGTDVSFDFPVSITQAVLGAEVEVPTVQGKVMVNIPGLSSSGTVLKLKGQGIRQGSQVGDQFIKLIITVPKVLSPQERALYVELARLEQQ